MIARVHSLAKSWLEFSAGRCCRWGMQVKNRQVLSSPPRHPLIMLCEQIQVNRFDFRIGCLCRTEATHHVIVVRRAAKLMNLQVIRTEYASLLYGAGLNINPWPRSLGSRLGGVTILGHLTSDGLSALSETAPVSSAIVSQLLFS